MRIISVRRSHPRRSNFMKTAKAADLDRLDREASRMGISRQAVLKVWLVERADSLTA
jgi:hypothetical protein